MTNYYEFYIKTDPSMFKVGQILKSSMSKNTMTVIGIYKDNLFKRLLSKIGIHIKNSHIKVKVYEIQKSST